MHRYGLLLLQQQASLSLTLSYRSKRKHSFSDVISHLEVKRDSIAD